MLVLVVRWVRVVECVGAGVGWMGIGECVLP